MRQAFDVFENLYGLEDVRTCKVKKNLALVYLRGNMFEEALIELKELEDLERFLFGDTSS